MSQHPRERSDSYDRTSDEIWPLKSHMRHVEVHNIDTPPTTAHTVRQDQTMPDIVAVDGFDDLDIGLDSQWSQYLPLEQLSSAPTAPHAATPCFQTMHDRENRPPKADRVAYLLHCILAQGFDSFEDLVLAYYDVPFLASVHLPHLCNKKGRTQELPGLISKLFQQTLREQSVSL